MKRIFSLAPCFLLCATPALGALALVDICTGQSDSVEPYDVANCTVSGADTYIACFVGIARSAPTVTSVTWDAAGANQALAAIANTLTTNANRAMGQWWGLANPSAGTNKSVTTNMSTGALGMGTGCLSFSGVDQAAPASGGAVSSVDGASASVAVTSAVGGLVLAGLVLNLAGSPTGVTQGSGETLQTGPTITTRAAADENINLTTFTEVGASSVTMNPSWTGSTDNVISAFSLKAAAATQPLGMVIISQ